MAVNVTLLAVAAADHCAAVCIAAAAPLQLGTRRPLLSIDISSLRIAQQQPRCMLLQWSTDETDRQTDRDTYSAPHTMRTVSISY